MTNRHLVSAVFCALLTGGVALAQENDPWSRFQLNADEIPKQTPWTEAASLSFVSGEGESSTDIDIAARYDWQIARDETSTVFVRGVAHVNDRAKSEEEVYKLSAGYHFEFGGASPAQSFGYSDLTLSYQQNTVFADLTSDPCVQSPGAVFCRDQEETRVIGAFATAFIPSGWESATPVLYPDSDGGYTFVEGSPDLLFSVSPVVSVFYDEVLDAATDPGTGLKIDGSAAGTTLTLGAYLSPRVLDYRVEFKASFKQMVAFSRDASRKPGFPANADLFTASLDYNLGKPSLLDDTGWRPAIGLSYSSGRDPLTGRKEKEETVLAFKLTHKAGK